MCEPSGLSLIVCGHTHQHRYGTEDEACEGCTNQTLYTHYRQERVQKLLLVCVCIVLVCV